MGWSREQRTGIARRLDAAERSLIAVMRVVMGIVLVGVLVAVAAVIANREPGGNHQGEYYYFGAAVLLVLGWIATQLGRLRRRERQIGERQTPLAGPSWKPTFRASREAGPLTPEVGEGYQRSFEFRFGTAPEARDQPGAGQDPRGGRTFTFNRSFEVPLASLPADIVPDEDTLGAIALSLRSGESLDHICEAVQPAYRDWGMLERRAYRFLVESKLAERAEPDRGSQAADTDEPL